MKTFTLEALLVGNVIYTLSFEHILLTGSRTWTATATDQLVKDLGGVPMQSLHHGAAPGADRLVSSAFARAGCVSADEVHPHPADWDRLGKQAGFVRNAEMARLARVMDAVVLACWDGRSRGTADTIEKALRAGLKVLVARMDPDGVSYHRAVLL